MVAKGKTVEEPAKDSWSRAWALLVIKPAAKTDNNNFLIIFLPKGRFLLGQPAKQLWQSYDKKITILLQSLNFFNFGKYIKLIELKIGIEHGISYKFYFELML